MDVDLKNGAEIRDMLSELCYSTRLSLLAFVNHSIRSLYILIARC